jgi:hypothetical protein
MYRDDLEAARAAIRTLEARLKAETKTKEAAQAREQAAQAELDQLRLSNKRITSPSGSDTARALTRSYFVCLALGIAVVGVMMLISRTSRHAIRVQSFPAAQEDVEPYARFRSCDKAKALRSSSSLSPRVSLVQSEGHRALAPRKTPRDRDLVRQSWNCTIQLTSTSALHLNQAR